MLAFLSGYDLAGLRIDGGQRFADGPAGWLIEVIRISLEIVLCIDDLTSFGDGHGA